MRADQEELNAAEVRDFFQRYGVKLKLITSYNSEANGKNEKEHPHVINALIKACKGISKQ